MNHLEKLGKLETKAGEEIALDQDLIILTVIASMLAVLGIKMDSDYILIGAMLVSPLFDPIISSAIFLISKNKEKFYKSLKSLVIIVLIGILSSIAMWTFLSFLDHTATQAYVLQSFTVFDIGLVAFLTGIVGTLLWIWPHRSNTSAGIAIAISLVPPIANIAAGVVSVNLNDAIKYSASLGLNIVGIYLGALLVLEIYVKRRYVRKL
ncbi:DUF389 domain-containing protein [Candidatus Nomurabacteria bacterium]|nr:DUF389 domain-containing protein [Candidatus Nomurabacteria bacterium]